VSDGSFRTLCTKEMAQVPTVHLRLHIMTFLILIPLMVFAVVSAAVPLLVLTSRDHRLRQVELLVSDEKLAH
jgi:hypothetical protein